MTTSHVNVAFCNDERYESGLHVALHSLLRKYEGGERTLRLFLFLRGFGADRIARLHETLASVGKPYELIARKCDVAVFDGLPSLHGDHLTYVRLLVPDLVDADRIVFLDSDVIVNTNIARLFDADLDGNTLGVVANGRVRDANDHRLLQALGMTPDRPYFNGAVLVFDASQWRARGYASQCLDFLRAHRKATITVDQTALNYVLRNDYSALPDKFNVSVYPTSPAIDLGPDGIFHLCGSPKPWDGFGRELHGNYALFEKLHRQTALGSISLRSKLTPSYFVRTAWLARSYWRTVVTRLRKSSWRT